MDKGARAAGMLAIAALALMAVHGDGAGAARRAAGDHAPASAIPHGRTAEAPTVFTGHPRLIVGGYRGPSVDDLRAACADPEMRGECDRIGGRHMLDDAMSYLLTDDFAAADRVRQQLVQGFVCGNGYEVTGAGGYAIAYDWVWPTLSAADRALVERSLGDCGEHITVSLRGNSPHLWHGYTSQAAALALIALAIDGPPRAEALRSDAVELFRGDALEAYEVVGGAWPEGYSYERTHFFSGDPPYQYVIDALRAWHSAVERDHPAHGSIFETIAVEEGDWLRALGRHYVYGTLDPASADGRRTLMRGGDMPTGQAFPHKQYRPIVDAIAVAYHDDVLAAWGRELEDDWNFVGGTGTYHPVHRYSLPYTLPIGVGRGSKADLPLGAIWGRDDLGYVITRSAWRDGATAIGYRAGKWFTGHQHMDQGHIDIWRRGPLAVDAGVYAGWGTDHRESFYSRTVAHNTVLVHQDGEMFEGHPGAGTTNDDGQRIHTHNKRGCAQCIQSVAEWRSHIGDGMHFEAARIDAFEERAELTVIESDLTSAYNSVRYATPGNTPKIHLAQRDLVFARPSLLLVADRVRTADGAGRPRFAMHFPSRPAVPDLTVVEGNAENGILVGDSSGFEVANDGGGALRGTALIPSTVETTLLGGADYRYWVDGANRTQGAEGHESEPAEPGLWRIEIEPGGDALHQPGDPEGEGALAWLLVHALVVGDAGAAPEPVRLVGVAVDPAVPGPIIGVRHDRGDSPAVVVLTSGAVPRQPLRYGTIDLETPFVGDLLVTNLTGHETYAVTVDGVRHADLKASGEGVAAMPLDGSTRVELGACPPPVGAGDPWRALCPQRPTPGPLEDRALIPLGFVTR